MSENNLKEYKPGEEPKLHEVFLFEGKKTRCVLEISDHDQCNGKCIFFRKSNKCLKCSPAMRTDRKPVYFVEVQSE